MARGNLKPVRNTQMMPRSGCIFCALKMPTIDVRGVTHHEALDAGKSAWCLAPAVMRSDRPIAPQSEARQALLKASTDKA